MIKRYSTYILLISSFTVSANDDLDKRISDVEKSSLTSYENVEKFVNKFKKAVRHRSCFEVSELTEYPLRINKHGKTKFIWNRTALCRYFPTLFSEKRISRVIEQDILNMPAGWRGLSFGNGDFWIQPRCKEYTKDKKCKNIGDYTLQFKVANIHD